MLPLSHAESAEPPPADGSLLTEWVPEDGPLEESDSYINLAELGLAAGLGARPSAGDTLCLSCLVPLPPDEFNLRWKYNVQHPRAAARRLSSRPNPRTGAIQKWTVQLRLRTGQLRLLADESRRATKGAWRPCFDSNGRRRR